MDCWIIEQSHMIDTPLSVRARDIDDLKRVIVNIAKTKTHRPVDRLLFREDNQKLYVGFVGEDGKPRRFMRLRKHAHA